MTASADAGDESFGTFCTARPNPGEGSIVLKRASPGVEFGSSEASSAGTQTAELAVSVAADGLSAGRPLAMVYLVFVFFGKEKKVSFVFSFHFSLSF